MWGIRGSLIRVLILLNDEDEGDGAGVRPQMLNLTPPYQISVMDGRKYDNVLSERLSAVLQGSVQLSLLLNQHKTQDKENKDSNEVLRLEHLSN